MRVFSWWVLIVGMLITSIYSPMPAQQESRELTIFAAASLADAFGEISTTFEQANPNVKVALNFGSSSTLATQILEGAPADVFASANMRQMAVVKDAGLLVDESSIFATNRLVVIFPEENPAQLETLADLAKPNVKIIFAAPNVPIREYAEKMFTKMAEDAAYGDAYREAVLKNVVSEEENVRQVVAKIALGEADAALVYSSDVTPDIADQVASMAIPDAFNPLATYPIAVLKDAPQSALAKAFIAFVLTEDGQEILEKWGFLPARIFDATTTPNAATATAVPTPTKRP